MIGAYVLATCTGTTSSSSSNYEYMMMPHHMQVRDARRSLYLVPVLNQLREV